MKPRRPRMTRQLAERLRHALVHHKEFHQESLDNCFLQDDEGHPKGCVGGCADRPRHMAQIDKDTAWLYRMRDWFDRKDG